MTYIHTFKALSLSTLLFVFEGNTHNTFRKTGTNKQNKKRLIGAKKRPQVESLSFKKHVPPTKKKKRQTKCLDSITGMQQEVDSLNSLCGGILIHL